VGVVAAVSGLTAASCRPPSAQLGEKGDTSPTVLLPGSSLLEPPALGDSAVALAVFIQRATGDTIERRLSEVRREQRGVAGRRGEVLLTSTWGPPALSSDSIIVERRGLAPVRERLSYRGSYSYQYSHQRITGTIARQDSATRSFDQTFRQDIFAFAEVDLLVRSLPFRQGLRVVVPLFSESDADQELDTMTVVGPDSASAAANGWVVRFADPAIVTRYVVSATSREILSNETTQRRTRAHLRYVRAP
jgi:hypothetical protein